MKNNLTKFIRFKYLALVMGIVAISALSSCASLMIGVGGHRSGVSVSTAVNARHLIPRQSAATRNNKRIKRRVRQIFADYRGAKNVKIKVDRGLVVLRGSIASIRLERRILKRVSRIRGVHTIRSKMRVRHAYNY